MKRLYDIFRAHPLISTDSRAVQPGSIFFALRGDNFDGNLFAADALRKGAAYAVVDDPLVARDGRYMIVDDVLGTLQQLALHHRMTLGFRVLAITGTNGKTTTKELVARVLASEYKVAATRGNLNNHIGVPLTLLSATPGTEVCVVEMGAGACGEIALLCSIAEPEYGIVTNVGMAHLEGFGGFEGVKRGKGELYDHLAATGGTAFVCRDIPDLVEMARAREGLRTLWYDLSLGEDVGSALEGDYNRFNAAAAVAIGRELGVDRDTISSAIASYTPSNNRSQRVDTGRNTVILDCYNANPSSMRVAVENLAGLPRASHRTAIVGDMFELGDYSREQHMEVVSLLASSTSIEEVMLVGPHFEAAYRALSLSDDPTVLPDAGLLKMRVFTSTDSLDRFLEEHPVKGRTILLKGSRGMELERVIGRL